MIPKHWSGRWRCRRKRISLERLMRKVSYKSLNCGNDIRIVGIC